MGYNFFVGKKAIDTSNKTRVSSARQFEREEKQRQLVARVRAKKLRPIKEVGYKVGRSAGQFGAAGQRQTDFSHEQEVMREVVGGKGDTFWGLPDSGTGVHINNDLNPRQRGDRGTAEMFGF